MALFISVYYINIHTHTNPLLNTETRMDINLSLPPSLPTPPSSQGNHYVPSYNEH